MRSLPDVTCLAPTSLGEVTDATRAIAEIDGTCFLRLDKDKGSDGPAGESFVLGRPRRICVGKDVAFFTCGGILSEVEAAAEFLQREGISCSIYSVHSLNPVEPKRFIEASCTHRAVVTVEEHTVSGGLGGMVLETFADASKFPQRFLRMGLDRCFSSVVGSQTYLRKVYKLDSSSIVRRTLELLRTDHV